MNASSFHSGNPGKPERPRSKHTVKVMVVDDHEIFRQGLLGLINSIDGFRVVAEASSMADTLDQLETTPVDLVLLDLSLPDSEGIEPVHLLKQTNTSSAIVIISASMDDDTLLDAVSAGVSGYLTKDTPATDIIKALQGFQRNEFVMLPAVMTRVIILLLQHYTMLEAELNTYLRAGIKAFGEADSIVALPPGTSSFTHSLVALSGSSLSSQLLTPREEKVLQLMRLGHSNKQIAAQLFISRFTVGKHVQNILRKLGVSNRTQAVSHTSFEGGG
jgi:DNA-binding NarL/FixJ family response regulator